MFLGFGRKQSQKIWKHFIGKQLVDYRRLLSLQTLEETFSPFRTK